MNKLKVGLIGFGKIGRIHANSVHNSSFGDLVAVCDNDENTLNYAQNKYNARTYTDIDQFLKSDIDAVVIATTTPMHLQHIFLTAKAKKSIFTEKPVGLSMKETDEVLAIVLENGVSFQIGFQRRWDPEFLLMKKLVDEGELGKPRLYKAFGRDPDASNPANWGLDKNGGLFLNAAIHDYDAARFMLNSEVNKVLAFGATLVHHGLNDFDDIDTCGTTLFMDNGCLAITEWSRYATYGYDIAAEVICENGRIELGSERKRGITVHKTNGQAPQVYDVFKNAYTSEINEFLRAVQNNSKTSPGIEDARVALQIAIAARESYTKQSYIKIDKLEHLTSETSAV